MQRNRTSWAGKALSLAFAAACVPVLSGWLIVTVLAVGIDS